MNKTLYSIQYMRGVAALVVVLFHFKVFLNNVYTQKDLGLILFNNGAVGVDLFFMLSGFIIAYSTKKDSSSYNFFIKRFFRIYPVYAIMMLIMITFLPWVQFDKTFIRSLFFLHKNYESQGPYFSYSTIQAAWTLTYEVMFYALFVFSMIITHKYRIILTSILIISLNLFFQLLFNDGYSIVGSASANYSGHFAFLIKIFSSPMMLEFVVGMAIYSIYEIVTTNGNKKGVYTLMKYTISISLSYSIMCYMSGFNRFHGLTGFGLSAICVILPLVIYEKLYSMRKYESLLFLGNISYSMYISHLVILAVLNYTKPEFFTSINGFSKLALMLIFTVIFSSIIHDFIEKPIISFSRKLIKK